ncbi:site-2 protease family protein [Streptomyces brasiliensis]|uniref:Peptidase M50 domain-containing protein n=1 Tax=Streptomyces brasiliensis TaxID=1954 RepID=A0A917UKB8_9ACTN|nr:site-2 protease family protein [Streptomyces brasiliensis]GGJ63631.1 hypothetical protein GCM10010121_087800 [Streptomyces brasiliensis]
MKGSIRIGTVRGVTVQAHWTVPLIMLVLAYSLARTLPDYAPGFAPVLYGAAGVVSALLLLISLVVHEVAHALVARRAGITVRDVTLWALGGLTRTDEPPTARTAFAIAVSGPLASLLLGGIGLGAAAGAQAVLGWRILVAVLGWLGGMNLLLGVFNLLPAAPLDGGRVLHTLVWWHTADRDRARQVTGRGGRVVGLVLVAVGWLAFLRGMPAGLWLMVIGMLMSAAAAAERQWVTRTCSPCTTAVSSPTWPGSVSPPSPPTAWRSHRPRWADAPSSATRHSFPPAPGSGRAAWSASEACHPPVGCPPAAPDWARPRCGYRSARTAAATPRG